MLRLVLVSALASAWRPASLVGTKLTAPTQQRRLAPLVSHRAAHAFDTQPMRPRAASDHRDRRLTKK